MKKLFITFLCLILTCSVSAFSAQQEEPEIDMTSQEARALYAQNDIDKAYNLLLTKGEEYRSAEDWLIIGNILQDKDKIDSAIHMYQKAIEKDPKYYKAHYNLGYIYLIQDRPNMADRKSVV